MEMVRNENDGLEREAKIFVNMRVITERCLSDFKYLVESIIYLQGELEKLRARIATQRGTIEKLLSKSERREDLLWYYECEMTDEQRFNALKAIERKKELNKNE